MPDLLLQPREQAALRDLFAAEPVPGRPIPPAHVMEMIARLIPCEEIGAGVADIRGYPVDVVGLPPARQFDDSPAEQPSRPAGTAALRSSPTRSFTSRPSTGPIYLGVMHWLKHPREAEACFGGLAARGAVDGVAVGFRNGPDHVTQFWIARESTRFGQRDLAMLTLINPILQRLLRERSTPQVPAALTVQERRVLMHVAAGRSNADIAEELFVAPSTIRKHLEHSYRKLGVNNRVAAVARLQGRVPDPNLSGR
jgi:DNA-binding CsgD family transcriptional regulator